MLDLNNYQLVADLSNNKLRKNGFSFGCYRRSVYKNTIEFRLYIDLEEQDVYEYMGAGWEEWYECTNGTCGYCCKI